MSPPTWDQPGPGRKAGKRPPPTKRRPAPLVSGSNNSAVGKGCALFLLAIPAAAWPLLAWIGGAWS